MLSWYLYPDKQILLAKYHTQTFKAHYMSMQTQVITKIVLKDNFLRRTITGLPTIFTNTSKYRQHTSKQSFQANNNRLANYIDKVRQLQTENRRMTKQIQVNSKRQNLNIRYNHKIWTSYEHLSNMNSRITMQMTIHWMYLYLRQLYSGTLNHFFCSDATTTLR